MAAAYRFLSLHPSYAPNGDRVVAELPLEQVKFTRVLSGAGGLQARLNARHPVAKIENLRAGYHQIAVERNGVIVWAGALWTVRTSLAQTALGSSDPYLQLGAAEWFSWFMPQGDTTRCLEDDSPIEWATIDQIDVAAQCIEMAQEFADNTAPNANIGVTVANNEASGLVRSDLGWDAGQFPSFGEIITGMADKPDGFDFTIECQWDGDALPVAKLKKTFHTYSPRRIGQSFGGINSGQAIQSADGTWDATRMGTHVIAQGASDASITSTQDAFTDYWRRDLVRTFGDIEDQTVLDAQAVAVSGRYGRPVVLPTVTILNDGPADILNSFQLGDIIDTHLDEGYLSIDTPQRIVAYDVTYNNGTEAVTFALNDPGDA